MTTSSLSYRLWGGLAICLAIVVVLLQLAGGMTVWAAAVALIALILAGIAPVIFSRLGALDTDAPALDDARQEQCRRFRSDLIESLRDPAIFVASDGRIDHANQSARRQFRFVGEKPLLSAVIRHPELLDACDNARATKRPQPFSISILDDPDRHYACRAAPVEVEQGIGVLIVMSDLTEVKRAEHARADFLANASHELRTPLTSLSGFIETMRGPAKDDHEAWDRFLEIMHGQAERMRRLVNDLLSLSRIELNEHHRPDTTADLTAVTAEVVDALEPVAAEKGVRLKTNTPTSAIALRGVRDELAQVVQNLVDNAVKYSEEGQVVEITVAGELKREEAVRLAGRGMEGASRMTLSASPSVTAQSYAILRVADEGPGIDRKHLPRLSERFYRVDPGRGLRRGTGLGLAIVKHIITRHQGDFLVESLVGSGTAFGVLLPITNPVKQHSGSDVAQQSTEMASDASLPEMHDGETA